MKICIDAGHYGKYNRSPAVKSYYESDMAWKLHLLLKKQLEEYSGVTVITTRASQNADLALEKRGKMASGCDLFISIHSNAVGSYISEGTDYPLACCSVSGKVDALGQKLAQCVQKTMGTSQTGRITKRKLANGKDYYGVLRGAAAVGVSGVLLEHSFHTNTKSTNWLLNDSNLEKLAKAEAEVIAAHYGLKKKVFIGATDATESAFQPYKVKVICSSLNIRKTPKWGNSDVVGTIKDKGVYTIIDECMLEGTKFGLLKSAVDSKGVNHRNRWISLGSAYVKKV